MKVVSEKDYGPWAVEHADKLVSLDGIIWYNDYSLLETRVRARGLFVWEDGSIKKDAPPEEDFGEPRGPGRPKKFEDYSERRRELREAAMTPEEREAAAERSKQWREENPDKVKENRLKAARRRKERYNNDPEYRAKIQAYQREQARKRREAREAAQS